MINRLPTYQEIPLDIVGGNGFGRAPIISSEQTFNMIESEGWLFDYAGYKKVASFAANGKGRGNFRSSILKAMVTVISNTVYVVNSNLSYNIIGHLNTYVGDVFIAEDFQGHIAICDKSTIWIYTPATGIFAQATKNGTDPLDFLPGYVAYQNGRFITVDLNSATWNLSDPAFGNSQFPNTAQFQGGFQTKADIPLAAFPMPGRGDFIFVMGSFVTEIWGVLPNARLFPYQRSSAFNIDYGCVNPATIGYSENSICWLAQNEKSGPFIVYSDGGRPIKISNDGLENRLSKLKNPQDSVGFMFMQNNHLFYQITFPTDNLSYVFDFNTKRIYTLTDPYMNYHPARHVAFFNNTYYFVSINDSNLYELSTKYTTHDGLEIPRIRITKTFRLPKDQPFITAVIYFPIETGESDDIPRVDIAISDDGGVTFSNFDYMDLQAIGNRRYQFIYNNLGRSNEITFQFRYWSSGRAVLGNGIVGIYQ